MHRTNPVQTYTHIYGYNCTASLTPYEDGVTKSAVVEAPASGVRMILTVVLVTRSRPDAVRFAFGFEYGATYDDTSGSLFDEE